MPIVEARIPSGYGPDDKRRLVRALTDAIRFVVPARDEAVTVTLHDDASGHEAREGSLHGSAPALPDPAKLVLAYLNAMEARDIETARSMLGPGFRMTFPGTAPMTSLTELIAWAKPRYRFVSKTYEAVEAFPSGGIAVVFARGTLAGEWPDGTPFSDIRFIDRFEVSEGQVIRQDVWNDLAEGRAT